MYVVCLKVAPRFYTVECKGRTYHHNRKDLRHTFEAADPVSEEHTDLNTPTVRQPQTEDIPKVKSPEKNL